MRDLLSALAILGTVAAGAYAGIYHNIFEDSVPEAGAVERVVEKDSKAKSGVKVAKAESDDKLIERLKNGFDEPVRDKVRVKVPVVRKKDKDEISFDF